MYSRISLIISGLRLLYELIKHKDEIVGLFRRNKADSQEEKGLAREKVVSETQVRKALSERTVRFGIEVLTEVQKRQKEKANQEFYQDLKRGL